MDFQFRNTSSGSPNSQTNPGLSVGGASPPQNPGSPSPQPAVTPPVGFSAPQNATSPTQALVPSTPPASPVSPAASTLPSPLTSSPTPAASTPTSGPRPSSTGKRRANSFRRRVIAIAVIIALLIAGYFVLQQRRNASLNSEKTADIESQFDILTLPLAELVKQGTISVGNGQTLSINGQLRVNNSLIMSPTEQPTSGVAGQMYYDQSSNQLAYYNGTEFIDLLGTDGAVEDLGGLTGTITVGGGLTAAGGQLTNTGVLSVQGATGDINFTSGGGIAIDGTTLTNTGVLSLGGAAGAIGVGNGLAVSGGTLTNTGVTSVSSNSVTLTVTTDANGNVTLTSNGAGTGTVTSAGGTPGRIAKFTGVQNIEDSLLSESGATVTVNGNLAVTGALTLGTLLSVANGGTGANSLALNGVLVGQGTSPITSVTAAGTGLCLMSTAGAPSFQACPGGGGVTSLDGLTGVLTIANSSGAGSTITIDNASTSQKGIASFNSTNFSVSSGAVNTIQDISASSSPTFASINTSAVTSSAGLTVGTTTQTTSLQGSNMTLSRTSGANTTTLSFVAPTANVTYRLQTAAAGTYDVCTTVGNCVGTGGGVSTSGGTTNRLAKFTGTQTIGDSLISDNGTLVTVGGNLSVTGTVSLTSALTVGNGGTGATTAGGARTNLGAAASGANSDITSISGLTTALSVIQGGTGATSLTTNGVLLGNGTSPISSLVAGGAGLCLVSTAGAPSWQACPGSGGVTSVNGITGIISIANASAAGSTITIDDASTSQKGIASFNSTNFSVSSGAVNTIQNINSAATPTFAGINTNTITPSAAMTVGATSQNLTLQGATTQITSTNGANTTALSFITPTANVTYQLQAAPAGTYDVCTTAGNCVGTGGGVSTSGGTTNRLAKFTGTQTISDSIVTDNGTTVSIGGNLSVTGTVSLTTALTVANGGTGAATFTANGVLVGNGTSPITSVAAGLAGQCLVSTAGAPTWQTCPGSGGVTSLNSLTGALTIANASTSGSTITIDDASTSQKGIASFNSTNFSVSSGAVNTIQDINTSAAPTFGQLTLTSNQATADMMVINNTNASASGNLLDLQRNSVSMLRVTAGGALTVAGAATLSGGATVTGTLAVNTITPSSSLTVGATAQAFTLQGNASSTITATNGGSTTGLTFQTPTANVSYRFATATAGTYDVCTTVGNCVGTGGGVTTAGGTTNRLAKFTASQAIGDSIITDNGTTVTIGGTLSVNTITPTSALTVGATTQNLTVQGATVNLTSTSGANTSSLTFATPTSTRTITIPDASGTVCLQNSASCGFLTGTAADYIQNQNASDQTSANFRIDGTGRAGTALQAPLLDTATAAALNIGTTNATGINLNKGTTITGALTQSGGAFSLTGNNTSSISTTTNALSITSAATATWQTSSGSLTLQSVSSSNSITISSGSMTLNSTGSITVGSGNTSTVNVGAQSNNARTVNVGYISATTQAQTINIGALSTTSATNIQGGTGNINLMSNAVVTDRGGFGSYQNFLTYSEQFDNAAWTKTNTTVTAGIAAGPNGQGTAADQLTSTSSGGFARQSYTSAGNNTYTFSVWMRTSGSSQTSDLRIDSNGTPATGTRAVVTVTENWQRFSVTQTFTSGVSTITASIFPGQTSGTGTVYAWGAQLEQSSAPGVYIPTNGTNFTSSNSGFAAVGQGFFRTNTDSTTAFQVQNSAGSGIFIVDTSGAAVDINGTLTIDASATTYTERLCHNQPDGSTTSLTLGDCQATGQADLAEMYATDGTVEPGDIVAPTTGRYTVTETTSPYQPSMMGVVSTNPIADGIIGNNVTDESRQPIALAGRIPLKVSLENGPIAVGDPLTSSSTPGVAMKATGGQIIGTALEAYDENSPRVSSLVSAEEDGRAEVHADDLPSYRSNPDDWDEGVGKIMMFLNNTYINGNEELQGTKQFQGVSVQGKLLASEINVSGKVTADSLTVKGIASINKLEVNKLTVASVITINGHIVSGGDQPTVDASGACQVNLAISGTDTAGLVTIKVDEDCAHDEEVAKIKFVQAFDQAPRVTLTPANSDSAGAQAYVDSDSVAKEQFTLAAKNTLEAGKTYRWYYQVIQ